MIVIYANGQALRELSSAGQVGRVVGNPVLMGLVHQRAAEQVVGAAFIAGHRNVPHRRHAQQGLDVRVMGLGLEGVPEEHQQVDPLFGDLRSQLLIAAQRAADHAFHRQPQAFAQQQPGGAGGDQLMFGQP